MKTLFKLGVVALVLSLSSCDGILDGIYDTPQNENLSDYGFIEVDKSNNSGVIYIDATSYTKWTFINFHTLSIDTIGVDADMVEPSKWDFAVHRYDTKTNGGSVLETGFTGLTTLKNTGKIPEGTYVEDIWTDKKIVIDMSQMMEGILKYTSSYYNTELSKWLNVDTSNMPPTYTPSNKVYILKLKDGTVAAIRLRNFMNSSNIKGYMTIEYIYPLEF